MKILDLLFPARCLGCGRVGRYFCDRCTSKIRIIEVRETICPVCERPAMSGATHPRCQTRYAIDGLTSFFHYDGIIRKAIKAIKYRFASVLAKEFIDLVPTALSNGTMKPSFAKATEGKQWDNAVIVPIPLHASRQRHRGFNQAEVLGLLLADRFKVVLRTDVLLRKKRTTPQVEMQDRDERMKNMDGVFSYNNETMKQCNNVLLFDDVFTTGATLRSAAAILKRSGITFVWGVTMAR